ncbi:hypothetical protein VRK_33550 [Vibrio sp. MEBiC08052]|nr:hypothetical protein VRK_33550 [Vibrio sp. MEBiC08052]
MHLGMMTTEWPTNKLIAIIFIGITAFIDSCNRTKVWVMSLIVMSLIAYFIE